MLLGDLGSRLNLLCTRTSDHNRGWQDWWRLTSSLRSMKDGVGEGEGGGWSSDVFLWSIQELLRRVRLNWKSGNIIIYLCLIECLFAVNVCHKCWLPGLWPFILWISPNSNSVPYLCIVNLSLSSPGWSARVLRLYWTVAARPDETHHKLAVLDEVNVDGYWAVKTGQETRQITHQL